MVSKACRADNVNIIFWLKITFVNKFNFVIGTTEY